MPCAAPGMTDYRLLFPSVAMAVSPNTNRHIELKIKKNIIEPDKSKEIQKLRFMTFGFSKSPFSHDLSIEHK